MPAPTLFRRDAGLRSREKPPPLGGRRMTAEIAIMNRQGVALAADSAVTIGRRKVWKTANKLFSLEPHNDIAIMIYHSGEFTGIPWETIVKCFREDCACKPFKTVRECQKSFFAYLNSAKFSVGSWSNESIDTLIVSELERLRKALPKYKTRKQMESLLRDAVDNFTRKLNDFKILVEVMERDCFDKQFRSDIRVIAKETFGFNPTSNCVDSLNDYFYDFVKRKAMSTAMSGIVFAGFGQDEMLPYCSHYIVDGRFEYEKDRKKYAKTRYWLHKDWNFNRAQSYSSPAIVIPFAQYDMFYLFMEGIVPLFATYIDSILKKVLDAKAIKLIDTFVPEGAQAVEKHLQEKDNEGIIKKFREQFKTFRQNKLVTPVLNVIGALPKEEMAAMAEALVELTALRRKIGSNLETVSGPTDVAVISKGEGLIWIKRKHYFDPVLNSDFAARKKLKSKAGGEHANA